MEKENKIIPTKELIIILISSIIIVLIHNINLSWYLKDIVIPFTVALISYLVILKKHIVNKKALFMLIPIVLILISDLVIKIDLSNKIINILALPICYIIFFFLLINKNFSITETTLTWLGKVFPQGLFSNLKYLKPKKLQIDKNKSNSIAAGILIGVMLGIMILILLTSADQYFNEFVSRIFTSVDFDLENIFILIISFILMYSILTNIIKNKTTKMKPIKLKEIDELIVKIALSIINSVFVLFLISEISKLTVNFLQLPTEYTYASYAREGFFQLLFVTIINISIILILEYKTNIINKNKTTKYLILALIGFSILLIFNSYYRMFLYIGNYGFTVLRLQVILFLAMELIVFIIFIKKILSGLKHNDMVIYYSIVIITYILNLYLCTTTFINLITE